MFGRYNDIKMGLRPITSQLSSPSCDEVFSETLSGWCTSTQRYSLTAPVPHHVPFPNASRRIERLGASVEKADKVFRELLSNFAEQRTTTSSDFLSTFSQFATAIEVLTASTDNLPA